MQAEDDIEQLRREPEASVDRQNFDEFFLGEHERLYRALFFITGSSHDAEELAQEAFLKIWERWSTIDRIEDPTAYLFRIALNGFRMRARRARTAARRVVAPDLPRDPYEEIELHEDVRQLLRGLPTRQRAALVLTEIFGYSSAQAAQIMGIRPTTVRVLASQGRAALRAT